jgi:hypothetical protein
MINFYTLIQNLISAMVLAYSGVGSYMISTENIIEREFLNHPDL